MYRQRYISVDLLDVCLLKPSTMLRTALRRARSASSAAPRRGIASSLNLLQLSTSDLQPARTWDAAEADGADAASGGALSPPQELGA